MTNKLEKNYAITLSELKDKVKKAQIKAALAVNTELTQLYWEIGKTISEQQKKQGWGSKVIERLSKDLQKEFPNMKGFSSTNLKYMKMFFEAYQGVIICPQVVDKLPWGHNRGPFGCSQKCRKTTLIRPANHRKWLVQKYPRYAN